MKNTLNPTFNATTNSIVGASEIPGSNTNPNRLAPKRQLHARMISSSSELREAQKLRWRVFADEMGARLSSAEYGVDADRFDEFCDHLIVRDEDEGRIVGCYRILSPENAWRAGGYYSEGEFDLQRLAHLRPRMVELGRSCIDAQYRSGAVIALLWSGLAQYLLQNNYQYLIGCASISMRDGGHAAASVYEKLRPTYDAPPEHRVFAHTPLPLSVLQQNLQVEIPPLIKGYLRAGARICGEPAWDPEFNTADLPILLDAANMSTRYAKHFLPSTA